MPKWQEVKKKRDIGASNHWNIKRVCVSRTYGVVYDKDLLSLRHSALVIAEDPILRVKLAYEMTFSDPLMSIDRLCGRCLTYEVGVVDKIDARWSDMAIPEERSCSGRNPIGHMKRGSLTHALL